MILRRLASQVLGALSNIFKALAKGVLVNLGKKATGEAGGA